MLTALEDIDITVGLLAGDRLDASLIEVFLSDKEPADLRRRIDAFLDSLSQKARALDSPQTGVEELIRKEEE